jgi:hypothetical protein
MLEVSGDSVIDAGIMPGDLVLVEGGIDPKDGDIDDTDNPKLPILARRCSQTIYPPRAGTNDKSSILGSSLFPVVSLVISSAWRQVGESPSTLTFTLSVAVRPTRAARRRQDCEHSLAS